MKRYFSISITLFMFSAINALTYFLLGFVYGNTAFSEVYSLTYPLQYIVVIFISFFASASNIRANKEDNKNCSNTGIVLGLVFGIIPFAITAIFVDSYINFMNLNPQIYRTFTLMAIGDLFFTYVINLVTEKLYFENQDKKANLCLLLFMVLNMASIALTTLITKNQMIILAINLLCLLIYCTVWLILVLKKFKFDFSITKNFKYESLYIVNDLFMFFTYLFGFSKAFSFGAEYVVALNFVNLITDPQWDALGAINKIAKIDYSMSNYNHKQANKYSFVITICYTFSSFVFFFGLFRLYKIELSVGIIFLAIQIVDMLLNSYKANLQSFLQLDYSPTKCTIINVFHKSVRLILSLSLFTPYNTNIGQLASGIIGLSIFMIIRFIYYKLDKTGFLVKKQKIKIEKAST